MYVHYPLRLWRQAAKAAPGAIFVVTSNTFFAPVLVKFAGRKNKVRVVHLLYDLFPDALEVAGKIPVGGFVSRMLGDVTHLNQAGSVAVVYLGDVLRAHAERRWGKPWLGRRIDVAVDSRRFPEAPKPLVLNAPIEFHYGGQLGYMHDAESLIAGIRLACAHKDCHAKFSFRISGARSGFLKSQLGGLNVDIGGTIPSVEWLAFARSRHVGLVSLSPGGATVCLPSKTYAMMAAGMAILAICPAWSDLANLITENGAGWVVNNSVFDTWEQVEAAALHDRFKRRPVADVADDFAAAAEKIEREPDELERTRRRAWRAATEKYGFGATQARWDRLFEELPL